MRKITEAQSVIVEALLESKEGFLTISDIQNRIDISRKTVAAEIQRADETLRNIGGCIETIPGFGFRLAIQDKTLFEKERVDLLRHIKRDKYLDFPNNALAYYIAMVLGIKEDYINIDEIATLLFYSRSTIASTLPKVKLLLKEFNLSIGNRAGYGIRLEGTEWNKRLFYIYYHKISSGLLYLNSGNTEIAQSFKDITSSAQFGYYDLKAVVEKILIKEKIVMPLLYQQLVTYYIVLSRVRKQFYDQLQFSSADCRYLNATKFAKAANELADALKEYGYILRERDRTAMAVLLNGYSTRNDMYRDLSEHQRTSMEAEIQNYTERIFLQHPGLEIIADGMFQNDMVCWAASIRERKMFGLPCDREVSYPIRQSKSFVVELLTEFAIEYWNSNHEVLSEAELLQCYYILSAAITRSLLNGPHLRIAAVSIYGGLYTKWYAERMQRKYGECISKLQCFEASEVGEINEQEFDLLLSDMDRNQLSDCVLPIIEMDLSKEGASRSFLAYLRKRGENVLEAWITDDFRVRSAAHTWEEMLNCAAEKFVNLESREDFLQDQRERSRVAPLIKKNGILLMGCSSNHLKEQSIHIIINESPIFLPDESIDVVIIFPTRNAPYQMLRPVRTMASRIMSGGLNLKKRIDAVSRNELISLGAIDEHFW